MKQIQDIPIHSCTVRKNAEVKHAPRWNKCKAKERKSTRTQQRGNEEKNVK
jgi:hypothetical protein